VARQRLLKPEFFHDEELARCSPHARLLFAGLWCLADKRGRLRDQPAVIHGAVFPFEPAVEVNGLLTELQGSAVILRYSAADGRDYIQVTGFEKHQNPHPKEIESVIPPPVESNGPAVKSNGSAGRYTESVTESVTESETVTVGGHGVPSLRVVEKPLNVTAGRMDSDDRVTYGTAVWETFQRRAGIDRSGTTAEWGLVERWMNAGHVLAIVLRGIEETGGTPRTLHACEPAVKAAVERWASTAGLTAAL
jgi:hypothetical protein